MGQGCGILKKGVNAFRSGNARTGHACAAGSRNILLLGFEGGVGH
jgi:hypothetical protein